MKFFRDRKLEEVQVLIEEYCSLVCAAVDEYAKMVRDYLAGNTEFKRQTRTIHDVESQADDLRMKIERKMYKGAFLPAYREDIIDLLEELDRVANKAEESGDMIYLMRPAIPVELHDDLLEITRLTVEAYQPIPAMVTAIIGDDYKVKKEVKLIDRLESQIDAIQFHAIKRVYQELDLDKTDKLVLKMLIDQLCTVSDRLENVGDHISIIAIKRKMA